MSDQADVANEKAAAILEDQHRQQEAIATKNRYLIAYCSGDGELVVTALTGSRSDRSAFMEATCGDPVTTNNWAFTHWSYERTSVGSWGKILAGDGEMEQKLAEYIAEHKPRPSS